LKLERKKEKYKNYVRQNSENGDVWRQLVALGDADTYQVSGMLPSWRLIANEHRFKGVAVDV